MVEESSGGLEVSLVSMKTSFSKVIHYLATYIHACLMTVAKTYFAPLCNQLRALLTTKCTQLSPLKVTFS